MHHKLTKQRKPKSKETGHHIVQNQLPDEDSTLVQHDAMQTCISTECHSTTRHILDNWNH